MIDHAHQTLLENVKCRHFQEGETWIKSNLPCPRKKIKYVFYCRVIKNRGPYLKIRVCIFSLK